MSWVAFNDFVSVGTSTPGIALIASSVLLNATIDSTSPWTVVWARCNLGNSRSLSACSIATRMRLVFLALSLRPFARRSMSAIPSRASCRSVSTRSRPLPTVCNISSALDNRLTVMRVRRSSTIHVPMMPPTQSTMPTMLRMIMATAKTRFPALTIPSAKHTKTQSSQNHSSGRTAYTTSVGTTQDARSRDQRAAMPCRMP